MISGLLWVVLVVFGFVGGCFGFRFAVWLSRFRLNTCVCILSSCVGLMLFVVLDSVFKLCLDLWFGHIVVWLLRFVDSGLVYLLSWCGCSLVDYFGFGATDFDCGFDFVLVLRLC